MSDDEQQFFYGLDIISGGETSAICIGKFPDRKSYAFYCDLNGVTMPLAYFRDEKYARMAADLIRLVASAVQQ